jgi:hypothetical protein
MRYNHVFQPISVIVKTRQIGFSFSMASNPAITNMKQCKYCDYRYSESIVQCNIPSCISDDEKMIKDLLE